MVCLPCLLLNPGKSLRVVVYKGVCGCVNCFLQSAATWANIARVHEAAGENDDTVMEAYDTAISLAKSSKDPKVLVSMLLSQNKQYTRCQKYI